MIPRFNLESIKRKIKQSQAQFSSRIYSTPQPIAFTSPIAPAEPVSEPQTEQDLMFMDPSDFHFFIPVNGYPPEPAYTAGEDRVRELRRYLASKQGALKIQGKRKSRKEMRKQLDELLKTVEPNVPPMNRDLMKRFGFVAGVPSSNRSNARDRRFVLPGNWNQVVSIPSYMIVGFSVLDNQMSRTIILQSGKPPLIRMPGSVVNVGGAVIPLRHNVGMRGGVGMQMLMLQVESVKDPQDRYIEKGLYNTISDLLRMISLANEDRYRVLRSIDSRYAQLEFFPLGIILVPKATRSVVSKYGSMTTGFHITDIYNRGTVVYSKIRDMRSYIMFLHPTSNTKSGGIVPGGPQPAGIDFPAFAQKWNQP